MQDILTFTTPETRWASNMAYCKVEHMGIVYPSVENYYQAMKFLESDVVVNSETGKSTPIREFIAKLSPSESKRFGKQNPITNPLFEKIRIAIMGNGNWIKYKDPKFRELLLATGDAHLEEGNWWHDRFWGTDIKTREGENNLGKILMRIRNSILASKELQEAENKRKEEQKCSSMAESL